MFICLSVRLPKGTMIFDRYVSSQKTTVAANNNSLFVNEADVAMNESIASLRTTSGEPTNVIERRRLRKNRGRPRIGSIIRRQNEENVLDPLSIVQHRKNRRRERLLLRRGMVTETCKQCSTTGLLNSDLID